jgi:GntR family transcriptional regulator
MTTARRTSRDPLYVRIYNEIASQIAGGTLSPTGKLPPERVISEQLGVSRATVRRALAALESDGLISAVQGRGTFVTTPRLAEPPNTLMSFTQMARDRSTSAGAVVLDQGVRQATIDEAERFRVAPGSDLFDLTRLRTVDSLPVAIDRNVVPLTAAPALAETDWTTASLYEVLTMGGSRLVRADFAVESRAATAEQAGHLQVDPGAPTLFADTRGYTLDGRLVQMGQTTYRGDRYRFRATLVAEATLPPVATDERTSGDGGNGPAVSAPGA